MKNNNLKKITKILILSFFVFIFLFPINFLYAKTLYEFIVTRDDATTKKYDGYSSLDACNSDRIKYSMAGPCVPYDDGTGSSGGGSSGGGSSNNYTLLAPLPGFNPVFDVNNNKNCPLHDYLNKAIKLIIGLIAVIAVVMIIMGGIEYMTSELVSGKANGMQMVNNALFGLLLALSSWLILNTINPRLLSLCLNGMPKIQISIDPAEDDSVSQSSKNGLYCTGTAGSNGGYKENSAWSSSMGAPLVATNSFLNFNNVECTYVGQKNCTSRYGLKPDIINKIYQNRTKYNISNITVTGGTECWEHGGAKQATRHRPSSPVIDLRFETNLDKYIQSGEKNGNWYIKDGVQYLKENDHWHAQI